MNTKSGKVLDNGRVVFNLKRKQSDQGIVSSAGATRVLLPKRRKLDGSKSKYASCVFSSGKRLLKYYSNFKKSGTLNRLMYYCDDEWKDFSQDTVTYVNKDFLDKKSAIEVEVNGNRILLDFLRMMLLHMNTGLHQPIAWIDVSGKCFFPEIFNDYEQDGALGNGLLGAEGCDHLEAESQGLNNINLNLEIEIQRLNDESSGESIPIVVNVQAHKNAALGDGADEVNSCTKTSDVEIDENQEGNQQMEGKMILAVKPVTGSLNSHAVMELFYRAVSSCAAKIVEIRPCKSNLMESRLELFEKLVEITKRYRGDANVQYAWLPCSSETVSAILKYGIGHYDHLKINHSHGNGIHLIPANSPQISISYFDVDENDTCHMVLCRVVMGNMELVRCGSNQFLPSSEDFDSGVDRLKNPNLFVVWNMNMNSHIYPECVVSFKVTSDVAEELVCGKGNRVGIPQFSSYEEPQSQVLGETVQARAPKSPWMPFPVLFAAIADKVTSESMKLVTTNYALFKNKKMNREEFVKKLRLIVGDNILKTAVTSLQCKVLVSSNVEAAACT